MSAVSKLIEVSYKDATNYNTVAGGDVMGVLFNHFWGPADQMLVLDRNQFFQLYPESLPIGAASVKATDYYAYAQIKRAFETGIPSVEVIRVTMDSELNGIAYGDSGKIASASFTNSERLPSGAGLSITQKYPGVPPTSMFSKPYLGIKVQISRVNGDASLIKISVLGYIEKGTSEKTEIIEEFTGSINPLAEEDGQSLYIENIVAESELIRVDVSIEGNSIQLPTTADSFDFQTYSDDETNPFTSNNKETINSQYAELYRDHNKSVATMLISPSNNSLFDEFLMGVSKERQDMIFVKGFPTSEIFTKSNILTGQGTIPQGVNFAVYVAGREIAQVFGQKISSNCTGGWCGSTATVAKAYRLNQLASAFTYGTYQGILNKSLTFDEVCELHEKGVISIFNSTKGALIWGVRALYSRQTSYYAKANVLRVLAAILRQWFPIALDAIHTDAAANPVTSNVFNMRFNAVLDEMKAQQNIMTDSTVSCIGDINSDAKTKGGTIFNIVSSIHFIGLTEKIKISITATDSSVNAKIG